MQISTQDWLNYVKKLRKLSAEASQKMIEYVQINGFGDTDALIDYAYALVTKYGEGSSELACEMYEAIAELEDVAIDGAIPASTASYSETAKAVNGSLIQSETGQLLGQIVDRLVKQASADTMLQNAVRDGAEFAWIPSGDTCAFCLTLSSRGWQHISKRTLKNGHAEHIHANCDCQYAVSWRGGEEFKNYDPDEYYKMYDSYDGSPTDRINAMRREQYQKNKEKINEQKRSAYAIRTGNEEA